MAPKAAILECEEKREIGGADILGLRIEPPASLRRGESPKEMSIAVQDEPRRRSRRFEGKGIENLEGCGDENKEP